MDASSSVRHWFLKDRLLLIILPQSRWYLVQYFSRAYGSASINFRTKPWKWCKMDSKNDTWRLGLLYTMYIVAVSAESQEPFQDCFKFPFTTFEVLTPNFQRLYFSLGYSIRLANKIYDYYRTCTMICMLYGFHDKSYAVFRASRTCFLISKTFSPHWMKRH